jgi:hypothetical protein
MKYVIALALTLMSFSSYSTTTVPESNLGNGSNATNAAVNLATGLLIGSIKIEKSSKNSITGTCAYNGGSCNGAEISLFYKDKQIYSSTLTSIERFEIPNLKRLETYKFVITWRKHQLTETRQVTTGEFVQITFKKN